MPSIRADVNKLLGNVNICFKYLPIKNIYVAAPEDVKPIIEAAKDSRIIFLNENEFIDAEKIKALYSARTGGSAGHAGWYIQQFIKMQFARFTQDEYYLIWDSDTIPVKPVKMFYQDMRPYFDMKTEYYPAYFETMNVILPGIYKAINKSFISEHMLIRSEYMREMLDEIEGNEDIQGKNFQEKIINAIDLKDIVSSGFSEFETFGNYVLLRHPESYILRDWHSMRIAGHFYRSSGEITERQERWLAEYYDAVSIEKWSHYVVSMFFVRTRLFQKCFSAKSLEYIVPITCRIDTAIRGVIPRRLKDFLKRIFLR